MKPDLDELRRLDEWLAARLDGDSVDEPPDPGLAARLLDGLDKSPGALASPPLSDPDWIDSISAGLAETGTNGPGARVGAFEIDHAIGAGGMGAVYLAHRVDGGFSQQVALKILAGAKPDAESIRQFQREREVLSHLEHPGIARLIDGGMTDDWRPWFAMEFIDGRPIDRYANENRLGVRQRLELFLKVCTAAEYAHGRLVLHRDIKPSNILVTGSGEARLLDFGLGRIQESLENPADLTVTQITNRWLTPEYASPEQINGMPVTVASEVYQLGLVLYRLLCDSAPYDLSDTSPMEMIKVICQTEPVRPSQAWKRDSEGVEERAAGFRARPDALHRQLKGDLDTILLTAIAKDPGDRYASVADFTEDLRRHLEHRPVRARVGTRRYRLGKFLRRYRLAVGATAAAFSLVVAALIVIAIQAGELTEERNRAVERAEQNARLSEVLTGMVHMANVDEAGVEQIVTVGERLEQYLDFVRRELADDPVARLELVEVIGESYEKLRSWAPAADVFDEAFLLARRHLGPEHERTLELQARLAHALGSTGEWERADLLLDQLENEYRSRYGDRHEKVAEVIFGRAYLYQIRLSPGDPRTADLEQQFATALEIWQANHDPPHEDLARVMHFLGLEMADRQAGLAMMEEGLEMTRALFGDDYGMVARRKNDIALELLSRERADEALVAMREAVALHTQAYGETHPQTLSMMNNLAGVLRDQQIHEEAIEVYRKNLELVRRTVEEDHLNLAYPINGLATVLRESGAVAESESWYREAVRLTKINNSPLEAIARSNLARTLETLDRQEDARQELSRAVAIFEKNFGLEHPQTVGARERLAALGP